MFFRFSIRKIEKATQKRFRPFEKIEFESTRSFVTSKYINDAKEKVRAFDLKVRIPVQTNAEENSVIIRKAEQQLKDGNFTLIYTVPEIDVFESAGGLSFAMEYQSTASQFLVKKITLPARCVNQSRKISRSLLTSRRSMNSQI